jgi:hypothetical protein
LKSPSVTPVGKGGHVTWREGLRKGSLPVLNAILLMALMLIVAVTGVAVVSLLGQVSAEQHQLRGAQDQIRQNARNIERTAQQEELAACLRDRKTVVLRNRIVRSIRDGHAINRDDELNQSDAGGGNPMVNRDTARRWQRLIDRTDYFPFRSCEALQEAVGR